MTRRGWRASMISILKKTLCAIILAAAFTPLLAHSETLPETRAKFFSKSLGAERNFRILLPPGYDTDQSTHYPVVYLLHGYNFVRNNPDFSPKPPELYNIWIDNQQLNVTAPCLMTVTSTDELDKCITAGGVDSPNDIVTALLTEYPGVKLPLPKMIIIMPDGGNSYYVNRADGKALYPPLDGPEYLDGMARGATGQFESYITRDLVDYIDSTYRTIPDKAHRGIGGLSMGGIGSALLACRNPHLYSSVTSMSAPFTLADFINDPMGMSYISTSMPEMIQNFSKEPATPTGKRKIDKQYLLTYDPYTLLKSYDGKAFRFYFDAGSGDAFVGMKNFEAYRKVSAALEKNSVKSWPANHVIPATDGNARGMHTDKYWRSRIGVILTFHALNFDGSLQ